MVSSPLFSESEVLVLYNLELLASVLSTDAERPPEPVGGAADAGSLRMPALQRP